MSVSGKPPYDPGNIFARILRGEIPCKRVAEDDARAGLPRHRPAGAGACAGDPEGPLGQCRRFPRRGAGRGDRRLLAAVAQVARDLGLEERGYRILSNMGEDAGQEVAHFHVHLFGGRRLGRMVARRLSRAVGPLCLAVQRWRGESEAWLPIPRMTPGPRSTAAGQLPDAEIDLGGRRPAIRPDRRAGGRLAGGRPRPVGTRPGRGRRRRGRPGGRCRRCGAAAAVLAEVIHGRFGYAGDTENYDDPANANLIRVVERRRGLPVALGILWLHAAEAAGWAAHGVDFPGHFLVAVEGGRGQALVDVFAGGTGLQAPDLRGADQADRGREGRAAPRAGAADGEARGAAAAAEQPQAAPAAGAATCRAPWLRPRTCCGWRRARPGCGGRPG